MFKPIDIKVGEKYTLRFKTTEGDLFEYKDVLCISEDEDEYLKMFLCNFKLTDEAFEVFDDTMPAFYVNIMEDEWYEGQMLDYFLVYGTI